MTGSLLIPGVVLTDSLESVLSALAPKDALASIELRRSPDLVPDIAVLMRDRGWSTRPWGNAMVRTIADDAGFNSIRCKGQRLTLRLSDDAIAELGSALEQGRGPTKRSLAGHHYLVDFCDPNANKALHVGHLRNLVLGHAFASLLDAAGARVTRQSVVCDIGRNIAEAMAGYQQFHAGLDPGTVGMKPDVFVGLCYSDYVNASGPDPAIHLEDPIARELVIRSDLAQELWALLSRNDPQTLALWNDLCQWALVGQEETLNRLGMSFDRLLFESHSLDSVEDFVRLGVESGVFELGHEGAIIYRTGKQQYETVVLVRPDGFPTEHMRALVLWARLQTGERFDGCIHLMGDEWVPSTIERQEILRRLIATELYDKYTRVPFGMVTVRGSKMKSSNGEVVLIDDLLDTIELEFSESITPKVTARIVIYTYFLNRPPAKPIEFDLDRLMERQSNPGRILADAWHRAQDHWAQGCAPLPEDAGYRFAVLQSQNFYRMLQAAISSLDVTPMIRYLTHLASWYVATPSVSTSAHRVVRTALQTGLAAIGIIPSEQEA
jgi:arginyl-tRNA synthetase